MVLGCEQRGLRVALGRARSLRRSASAASCARRLAAAKDSGARTSIFFARACAHAGRSSSATSLTRPSRSAACASRSSPPSSASFARARPTSLTSRATPPCVGTRPSGPRGTAGAPGGERDPPVAGERERQADARGDAVDRGDDRLLQLVERVDERGQPLRDCRYARASWAREAPRSPPAQNAPPAPVTITRADLGRCGAASSIAAASASRMLGVDRVPPLGTVECQRHDAVAQIPASRRPADRLTPRLKDYTLPNVSQVSHLLKGQALVATPIEELAQRTEDEVKEHLAAGKLVEGLQHMSPEYLKGIRRILTVSADTELVSAPSYLRAAQHAPALNNFGSAMSIVQDELAHAHIGYRLLGDLGVDMDWLIYERPPEQFKYPYAFDLALDSWHRARVRERALRPGRLRPALRRAPARAPSARGSARWRRSTRRRRSTSATAARG